MSSPFLRPNDTSTGGAGGGACGGYSNGSGRVTTPIVAQARPFPWPLPYSAMQGGVGGPGGSGRISVSLPPWSQPYHPWGPWEVYPQGWLPWGPIRS
jgi:hypothetical protein